MRKERNIEKNKIQQKENTLRQEIITTIDYKKNVVFRQQKTAIFKTTTKTALSRKKAFTFRRLTRDLT